MRSIILIRDPQTKEEEQLLTRFNDATKRHNDPKAGADGANAYSIAYQALVKAGLAQQIKRKFR